MIRGPTMEATVPPQPQPEVSEDKLVSKVTWLLDYREHNYGDAIFRGVEAKIDGRAKLIRPDSAEKGDPVHFQSSRIEEAASKGIGQVIIVPARDSDRLWRAMQNATRDGVFLISIDTKPIRREFVLNRVAPPRFICARYDTTGDCIAQLCVDHLSRHPTSRAILWTGPENSWAGEERSRRIVYALAGAGLFSRVDIVPLPSWEADEARCEATLRLVRLHKSESTVVYTADDENALALHDYVQRTAPELRRKLLIIGCNGTPDAADRVPALEKGAVDATVDLSIVNQGREAAKMVNAYKKGRPNIAETVYLEPTVRWDEKSPFYMGSTGRVGSTHDRPAPMQYGGVGTGEEW